MLEKYKGINIKEFPCYEICEYDEDILRLLPGYMFLAQKKCIM